MYCVTIEDFPFFCQTDDPQQLLLCSSVVLLLKHKATRIASSNLLSSRRVCYTACMSQSHFCCLTHDAQCSDRHCAQADIMLLLLQALADSCMHADKEQRPSFDDLLVTLDELQQELSQQEESSLKRDSAPTHTNGLET
jgi:hypothetical protein